MSRADELRDTAAYLNEHAKDNFARMPERTVANVLNRASPEVRAALTKDFLGRQHLVESGGRLAPFQDRVDPLADMPETMRTTYQRAEDEQTYAALNDRMGTLEQNQRLIDEAPVTLRDTLDAAFGD